MTKKKQNTCPHIWTHGSTRVKTNTLLATREKTLVLVFFLFPRSPQCCYISARITIRVPLCHSHIRARHRHKQTHRHIAIVWNPLQRKSSVRKTDSRHKLNLFIIMTQSVHSFLICIVFVCCCFISGGGAYIYTVFTLQCKFLPANIFQRATKLWVFFAPDASEFVPTGSVVDSPLCSLLIHTASPRGCSHKESA